MQFKHAEAASAISGEAPAAVDGPAVVKSPSKLRAARTAGSEIDMSEGVTTFVRQDRKVGRNEPCPCGSGKKYKRCHGRLS